MSFHRERHAVLAGNVANVDTPGFQPLELERVDAGLAQAGTLASTAPGHQVASGPDGAAGPSPEVRTFADPDRSVGPDGNAVSLERELAKIDANRVRYGVSSELVSRRMALLRYAASDGG